MEAPETRSLTTPASAVNSSSATAHAELELGAKYHDREFAITKAVPARHGASSNAASGGGLFL